MNIVIDTNVVVSGTFFGGYPRRVLEAIVERSVPITAFATADILDEYCEIVDEMVRRKQGHLSSALLTPFIQRLQLIETTSDIRASRDQDDDKFLSCAVDSRSLYIVSGDKDLLVLGRFQDVEIVTAAEFCRRYLE
jgi:putative PIN family toxin of toxin-antitoxin system